MIAEIISTGDEVLLGDITDTNSSYLCRQLKEAGITVSRIMAVGDNIDDIRRALEATAGKAKLCLVTGGLGPTRDDLTAEAAGLAAGVALEKNKGALESMAIFFEKRGYELTRVNEKQAWLPKGAEVIGNDHGTAPGFGIEISGCRFFFMPGVPSEMKKMFAHKIRPKVFGMTGGMDAVRVERIMVFGLGESVVGDRLKEFEETFTGLDLGFRAQFPLIEVKIVARSRGVGMAAAKMWVLEQLGSKVISDKGLTLAQEVGRLLAQAGQTMSVAESCTGGLISNLITDVSGASDYFLFSATTYANSAKMDILGVGEQTLIDHGAVSESTARQMANGARRAGKSDWAISTTGIAGPTGGTEEKPVGTVCIGVAGPHEVTARRFVLNMGSRARNKEMFAATALEMLRRALVKD